MQPFSLSPNYCLANVLPDRCSTGLAIPGVGNHPRVRELPVRSHRALPECRYRPNWLPPTPPESPDDFRPPPAGYSRTALSAHSLTITRLQKCVRAFTVPLLYSSGLSPYRCSTPNRTINHQGSTWISLTIHRTQSPQHLYIDSHNTLYFLYD